MRQNLLSMAAMLLLAGAMSSCAQEPEPQVEPDQSVAPVTRAYGDKSPKVMVYYEINDTNPLNALCYEMNSAKFIDIVQLFASNIHKDASGYPSIYFNDKLAPVMAAATTYIAPLRTAGIKVLLNVLGDHKGIGVANLSSDDMIDRFADILVYCVDHYNLDGIGFDDEYADYSTPLVPGSFGKLIQALHAKLDTKYGAGVKMIEVFQWGNYGQINATQGAMIDLADHGTFGPNVFVSSSSIAGMTNARWCPQAIEMGQSYSAIYRNQIKNRSSQAASGNYGGIMMFNVRKKSDVDPLPVFQAIADGAFNSATVSNVCTSDYSQDWTPDPNGYTITKNDVPAYLPTFTSN